MTSSPSPNASRGDYTLPGGRTITWVALVRMLLALRPTRAPDVATVAAVFRDDKFSNLSEVAQAFEVSLTTVRKDWRALDMPGSPEDGWPVGELFRWYLLRVQNRDQ